MAALHAAFRDAMSLQVLHCKEFKVWHKSTATFRSTFTDAIRACVLQLEEFKRFRNKTAEGAWGDIREQPHSFVTRVANWALDTSMGERLPVVQAEKADSISVQPAGASPPARWSSAGASTLQRTFCRAERGWKLPPQLCNILHVPHDQKT